MVQACVVVLIVMDAVQNHMRSPNPSPNPNLNPHGRSAKPYEYMEDKHHHHCTITVPSLYHHCTITVPSLYHHCTITAPSLHHHDTITAPSLHHQRWSLAWYLSCMAMWYAMRRLSLHHHCTITAPSLQRRLHLRAEKCLCLMSLNYDLANCVPSLHHH